MLAIDLSEKVFEVAIYFPTHAWQALLHSSLLAAVKFASRRCISSTGQSLAQPRVENGEPLYRVTA